MTVGNPKDAFEAFRRVVTQWVQKTDDGKELWLESSFDLNIGDLLGVGFPSLLRMLPCHGIHGVHVDAVDFDYTKPYDKVLPCCMWGVRNAENPDEWWNNDTGWGSMETATEFDENQVAYLNLPIGGRWDRLNLVKAEKQ